MKNFFALFILIISLASTGLAQPSYEVIETPKLLIKHQHNSYTINILGVDADMVADFWVSKMKKSGGEIIKGVDVNAIAYKNVVLPTISDQPIQVYFRTYEDTQAVSTHLIVWFRDGDQFVSSRSMPESFKAVSRFLIQFSFDMEDSLKKGIEAEDLKKAKEAFPKTKN